VAALTHQKCARGGVSLTHEGMRALGAPAGPAPAGPLGPDDGTDDGAAAGGHEDERHSVQARRHGREGPDPGRVCAKTGWHRNHTRRALTQALTPRLVRPRAPRRPIYGAEIIAALAFCWVVLGAPTGKQLAPIMADLVPTLRRFQDPPVSQRPQPGAHLDMRRRATVFTHRLVNGPSWEPVRTAVRRGRRAGLRWARR